MLSRSILSMLEMMWIRGGFFVTYPMYKPDRFRDAKWFDYDEVRVEWIRDYIEEDYVAQ